MLTSIRISSTQKVQARHSQKSEGPFQCPACQEEVILKKGKIKVHHFAHKPPVFCHFGLGESEAHRVCKEEIYSSLSQLPHVSELDIEVNFGSVISDVFCKIAGTPIAIEIQRSNINVNEIYNRTVAYEKLGINVLWLSFYKEELEEERYSPKAWEKWCHATYFGRVYYWKEALAVVPIHFSPYKLHVESSSWHDSSGDEQYGGGYTRVSKRYVSPLIGPHINFGMDFKSSYRREWSGGSIHIPNCRIYMDKLKRWW